MDSRLTITLSDQERDALRKIALQQVRPLSDQVRHIIRQELERQAELAAQEEIAAGALSDEELHIAQRCGIGAAAYLRQKETMESERQAAAANLRKRMKDWGPEWNQEVNGDET